MWRPARDPGPLVHHRAPDQPPDSSRLRRHVGPLERAGPRTCHRTLRPLPSEPHRNRSTGNPERGSTRLRCTHIRPAAIPFGGFGSVTAERRTSIIIGLRLLMNFVVHVHLPYGLEQCGTPSQLNARYEALSRALRTSSTPMICNGNR